MADKLNLSEKLTIMLGLEGNFNDAMKTANKSTSKFLQQVMNVRKQLKTIENNKIKLDIKNDKKAIADAKKEIQNAVGRAKAYISMVPKLPQGVKDKIKSISGNVKIGVSMAGSELNEKIAKVNNVVKKPYYITMALKQVASNEIQNLIAKPKKLLIKPVAHLAEVNGKIANTFNNVKKLASKPVSIAVKAIDKTKAVFGSIKNGITGIKEFAKEVVLGDNAKSAFNATIGAAMQGEQQQLAMKHSIGAQNQGKSKEEISSITDNYMEALKGESTKAPFNSNDIISAGRKAVDVMNGDTDKSMGLVKIAQDMAAVNPDKSLDDAMQALADMKSGDFSKASDFGFNFSSEEFKALAGKGSGEELTDAEMSKAFDSLINNKVSIQFAGGTDELSKTAMGQWSIISGNLQTMGSNFGSAFLPIITQILGPLGQLLGNNTGAFVQFGQSAATVVQSIANSIGMFLTPAIEWIKTNLPMIQTIVGNVFNGIATLLQPIMAIFGSVFEIIGAAIQNFGPIVTEIAATIMGKLGEVLEWLGPKIDWLKELFISSMPMISDAVQIAWDVINPALDLGITVFEGIADAVMWAMPIVQDILEKVWVVIEPIARGIGNVLGHVFDLVNKVIGFFGISASDEKRPKGHATGLPRVPYNNYPALLHEGEVVLTKKEANQVQNRGSNNFNMSFNISGSSDPNLVAKQIVNEIKQAAFNI
ncbi:hypothetical protein [Clostridium sp. Marseille-Q7071]